MWKKMSGIFNLLRKAHFSHNTIHHNKTYKKSYFIQFESPCKKESLDSKLKSRPQLRILGDRYGLSISGFWEIVVFVGVPLTINSIVFILLAPSFLYIGLIIAILPMLLSKYLHPLLHVKKLKKNLFISLVMQSRFFISIQNYHFLHHKYVSCNYNLLPGGDYLMRVCRKEKNSQIITSGEYGRK